MGNLRKSIFPKRIHHLIRYFIPIGLVAFVIYWMSGAAKFSLILIGPSLYLAYWSKHGIESLVGELPSSEHFNDLAFVFPIALVYFGLIGFQLKQLWNERGLVRTVSLFALVVFLIYIHFRSWHQLLGYYQPLP